MKYRCTVVVRDWERGLENPRRTLHFTIKTTSLLAAREKAERKAREVYDDRFYHSFVEDISEGAK